MTQQSGQGEDPHLPSVRHAHEGVVLPADGGEPLLPGTFGDQAHAAPAGGSPWGQPWGPETPQHAGQMPSYEWGTPSASPAMPPQEAPHTAAPLPPAHAPQQQPYAAPQQSYGGAPMPPAGAPAAPMPPAAEPYGSAPMPPAAASEATQYIPPQHIPAQDIPAQAADADATQLISPLGPGALPPEVPADATQFLGRANAPAAPQQPPAQPLGGAPMPPAGADSEATQYIAPVPSAPPSAPYGIRPGAPGDRQPPAEFDSLFRTEPEPDSPGATQQMPRFDPRAGAPGAPPPGAPPQGAYEPPAGRAAARQSQGKDRSRMPLVAAIGVGILVVGIGAGALIGSGGDGSKANDAKPAAATAPSESASPAADPAKAQAVALDKLLADSNNSRSTVIRAVADIGACRNLGSAATDLRDAATQRNSLVTRLSGLSVDKLPDNAALTQSLTKAWHASASADSHYAAWADQVGGKNGCKKHHARVTQERHAGDQASGTASTQKTEASKLWNAIAAKYSLQQRRPFEL
ncbi:hypothetical protein [Streptomyces sp. NPDC046821]|uniref:hypothetical protein n=1 Tax=Streptomyces sp. NPDC046821 TaxID=3154702 RepID=UPI0033EE1534